MQINVETLRYLKGSFPSFESLVSKLQSKEQLPSSFSKITSLIFLMIAYPAHNLTEAEATQTWFFGQTSCKQTNMKTNSPVLPLVKTDFSKIDANTDIETIRLIFNHSSKRFLPVVKETKFVGVILREDFLRKFVAADDYLLTAKDLISKEIIKLSPENTISEAMEVFSTNVYYVIPIANNEDELLGMIHMEEVGQVFLEALSLEKAEKLAEADNGIASND
ncbi:MAG: CBS domain-containing protein [Bacteroidetes bacterium]|nr:CBS domain-containing protein [Bacteroidota bacterium]